MFNEIREDLVIGKSINEDLLQIFDVGTPPIRNEEMLKYWVSTYKNHTLSKYSLVAKLRDIENYFRKFKIRNAVVGISGGVDSALVAAMLNEMVNRGVLDNVYGVTIHYDAKFRDVTSHNRWYVKALTKALPNITQWWNLDMSSQMEALQHSTGMVFNDKEKLNNVLYAMRYNTFFAIAQQLNAVTIGTTNFDECGYIGWFGKNSDMVVDIQPIMDLHKFQVKAYAKELGVPEEIIDRAPTGELPSEKTDEEIFGCTYDELSLYTAMQVYRYKSNMANTIFMQDKFLKVNTIRSQNLHKYQGQGYNPYRIATNWK